MNATPLGRFGTPTILPWVVFTWPQTKQWVTGSELVIDGGVVSS